MARRGFAVAALAMALLAIGAHASTQMMQGEPCP